MNRVRVSACLSVVFLLSQFGFAQNATSASPELVGQLSKELSITPAQATGGAGALFGVAKSRRSRRIGGFLAPTKVHRLRELRCAILIDRDGIFSHTVGD